jgi:hypothetical protein
VRRKARELKGITVPGQDPLEALELLKRELEIVKASMMPPNHPLAPFAWKRKLAEQARLRQQIEDLEMKLRR